MNKFKRDFLNVCGTPVGKKAMLLPVSELVVGEVSKTDIMPAESIYRVVLNVGAEVSVPSHKLGQYFVKESLYEHLAEYFYGSIREKTMDLRLALMKCESHAVLWDKLQDILEEMK